MRVIRESIKGPAPAVSLYYTGLGMTFRRLPRAFQAFFECACRDTDAAKPEPKKAGT